MKSLKEALVHKHMDSKVPNPFGLTEKDLIRDIARFPMGVVVRMMEEQVKQDNSPKVSVFQHNKGADFKQGGFIWGKTDKGFQFWHNVIADHDFNLFFEKYPEYKKYNI